MSVLKANKNTPNVLKRAFPDSDFDFFSASKRPHFGDATMKLTTEQLSVAEKQDLVTHVIALQEHIATLERTAKSNLAQTSAKVSSNSVHATMTPEEQAAAVQKVRNIMITGIRSQMTWKQSCKTGRARFSYTALVPSPSVFFDLFNVPQNFKKKTIQMTPDEFSAKVAKTHIYGSVRYSNLYMTGEKISVRWNLEDLSFTVSGMYGK